MDFRKVKRVSFSMFLGAIALVFVMNFLGAGSPLYLPMGFLVVAIIIAALILKTSAVFYYLPYLLIAGIVTGYFTGLCVWFLKKNKSLGKFL